MTSLCENYHVKVPCWAAPCKPAIPVLEQPQVQRKSLESAIEINVNSLKDDKGGSYTSEARSYSDTPLCAAGSGQDKVTVFAPGGRKGELDN